MTQHCLWCETPYTPRRVTHRFCQPKCTRAYDDWVKDRGGAMARLALDIDDPEQLVPALLAAAEKVRRQFAERLRAPANDDK